MPKPSQFMVTSVLPVRSVGPDFGPSRWFEPLRFFDFFCGAAAWFILRLPHGRSRHGELAGDG